MIPLTDDELRLTQLTVTGKILRLRQDVMSGNMSQEQADRELDTLCSVAEKCAGLCSPKIAS